MAGLTDTQIRSLKAPAKGRVEYPDDAVPGLRVRVSDKGKKSFILRKWACGKQVAVTVGTYGQRFGIADARKKARALLSDLEVGKLPSAKPVVGSGTAGTIRSLLPAYLASKEHLRSHREIKRILEGNVLPVIGDRFADAITRADVTALVDDIAKTAPVMARAVLAQLSAFYSWAMPRLEKLQANPCRDAGRPAKPKARDRVLSDAELRALWMVADAEPMPWGPGLKLAMLTAARRMEIFDANWSEFDLDAAEWVIPPERAKNGVAHVVPLSEAALVLLRSIPVVEGSPKVFPTRTKAGQAERGASGFSKALRRWQSAVDKALDREACEHWTLHDVRRSVATGLQRIGTRIEVTEAILNHVAGSRGGIAGVYQRHDWKDEKRQALGVWAEKLASIVEGGEQASNVVRLSRP